MVIGPWCQRGKVSFDLPVVEDGPETAKRSTTINMKYTELAMWKYVSVSITNREPSGNDKCAITTIEGSLQKEKHKNDR